MTHCADVCPDSRRLFPERARQDTTPRAEIVTRWDVRTSVLCSASSALNGKIEEEGVSMTARGRDWRYRTLREVWDSLMMCCADWRPFSEPPCACWRCVIIGAAGRARSSLGTSRKAAEHWQALCQAVVAPRCRNSDNTSQGKETETSCDNERGNESKGSDLAARDVPEWQCFTG